MEPYKINLNRRYISAMPRILFDGVSMARVHITCKNLLQDRALYRQGSKLIEANSIFHYYMGTDWSLWTISIKPLSAIAYNLERKRRGYEVEKVFIKPA